MDDDADTLRRLGAVCVDTGGESDCLTLLFQALNHRHKKYIVKAKACYTK